MPIRIYALAKELNLDSKELVDICKKAGIPGKGSALASLDDDEAVKVRAFIDSAAAPAAATPQASIAAAPERPSAPTKANKPKVFTSNRRKAPISIPGRKEAEPDLVEETVEEEPVVEEEVTAVAEPEVETQVVEEPDSPEVTDEEQVEVKEQPTESAEPKAPAPQRRGVLPVRSKPIKVFGNKAKEKGGAPAKGKGKQRTPAIPLAKMPTVKQPKAPVSNEPAPQKPELKLPQDAIDGKRGKKAPLNLAEFKSKTEGEMGMGPGQGGQDIGAGGGGGGGGKKSKRGKGKGNEKQDSGDLHDGQPPSRPQEEATNAVWRRSG